MTENNENTVPLWAPIRQQLEGAGATAETIETVRSATAPVRHAARVHAAEVAALAWGARWEERPIVEVKAAAVMAVVFESWGLGGYHGLGGPSRGTIRHPAFRGLGKGRAMAADGQAWTAAITSAFRLGCGRIWVEPLDLGRLNVLWWEDGDREVEISLHPDEGAWAVAFGRRAVVGLIAPEHVPTSVLGSVIRFGGDIEAWARWTAWWEESAVGAVVEGDMEGGVP